MPHSLRRPPMASTLWITDIYDTSLFPLPPLILHALPRQRRDRSRYWLMTQLLTSSQPPVSQRREDGSIQNRAPMHLMLANANTDPQNNNRHIHTNLQATKWGGWGGVGEGNQFVHAVERGKKEIIGEKNLTWHTHRKGESLRGSQARTLIIISSSRHHPCTSFI